MHPTAIRRIQEATEEPTFYYHGITEAAGEDGVWEFADRYRDVAEHVRFEPTDTVLDVGCAEGLISMEVASQVQRVDAYELSMPRVEAAQRIAAERGLSNITFGQANAAELAVSPLSYDVVLFLGVFHHMDRNDKMPTLVKLMTGARRLFVMRTPLIRVNAQNRLGNIYTIAEQLNFAVTIYPNRGALGGNLMVMWRN